MARGSSGRAAGRGGRVAVPPKRALQSGVTDDTSNKKQAVGGGGPAPSSAPVTQNSAEGAHADSMPLDGESPELDGGDGGETSSLESQESAPAAVADGADGGESSSSESPTAQRRGRPKKDPVTKAAEAAKKARMKADKDQVKQVLSYITGSAADCMCAAFEKVKPRGGGPAWDAVATEFHVLCKTHNWIHPHDTISHEHITAEHLKRRWTQLSREPKPTGTGKKNDLLRRVFAANDAVKSLAAYGDADDIVFDGGFQGVIAGRSGDDLWGILEIRSPRSSEESGSSASSVTSRRNAVAAEAARAPTLSALLDKSAEAQRANTELMTDALKGHTDALKGASNQLVGVLSQLVS
jgi:hypothetical protein